MEMEPGPPAVAKKRWSVVRMLLFMIKAGISKSKILVDLRLMLKRGNKIAGKAIGNLIHHTSSPGCRYNDALSSVNPKEYEFSCSNSPAFYPFYAHKRKSRHQRHKTRRHLAEFHSYDDVTTVEAVQKAQEMLNNEAVEASPLNILPGFERSPPVRQLRITDSPFPLKDEGDSQVDKAAEEFIKKFYKDLKLQKTRAAIESPYHDSWGR